MTKTLPKRPHLDHLRKQAKTLLSKLNDGDAAAARTFIKHLPEARGLSVAAARSAGFRLADAQSAVARQTGFTSWPSLSRHVQQLNQLEGEWSFASLQVDGTDFPKGAFAQSRILIDGDRFRTESPEANYEGVFIIDVDKHPHQIDIEFVEGPEAGKTSYGLFELDGPQVTFCLGLVGSSRPDTFHTTAGSGHALERLKRVSTTRPENVMGGRKKSNSARVSTEPATSASAAVDASAFNVMMTPLMMRLEGEWLATEMVRDGKALPKDWLAYGSRVTTGNEVKIAFGGQTMLHAKIRIDENTRPMQVDYLNLSGTHQGKISLGIMEWVGDEARFLTASPGEPRPERFMVPEERDRTLSQWRRK